QKSWSRWIGLQCLDRARGRGRPGRDAAVRTGRSARASAGSSVGARSRAKAFATKVAPTREAVGPKAWAWPTASPDRLDVTSIRSPDVAGAASLEYGKTADTRAGAAVQTLQNGGGCRAGTGDTALADAAGSGRCHLRLAELRHQPLFHVVHQRER